MDSKLSGDEISALQSFDADQGPSTSAVRAGDLPKRLFEFNLVARQPTGETTLTRSGQRALFQHECMAALSAMERGEDTRPASGVEKWLVSSGFAAHSVPGKGAQITPRGKLWLTSFEPDMKVEAAVRTAEYFAARRS
jgi:hypothetical protein